MVSERKSSHVPNDDMSKEMRAFLDKLRRDIDFITDAVDIGAAGLTQIGSVSGVVDTPAEQDYRILEDLPYGATLTSLTTRTLSGSCKVTLKINTALAGAVIATTTDQQTADATGTNEAVAGDSIVLALSNIASASGLSYSVAYTYQLQN